MKKKFCKVEVKATKRNIFDVSQPYNLRIVKFSGETVIETKVDKGNNVVDMSKLRSDTYVIQLVSGGRKQTSILIKD